MAKFRDVLRRLFSRNIILTRIDGNRLKAFDVNKSQSIGNRSMAFDRYGWRYGRNTQVIAGWGSGTTMPEIEANRALMYDDYESMDTDSIIASALDIYSDEICAKDASGDMLIIRSDDAKIKKILYNLFYDILNIEFNLWSWVRAVCKYGDFFLLLVISEEDDDHDGIIPGVVNVIPIHPSALEREDGYNEENVEATRFKYVGNFSMFLNQNDYLEDYEVAHFRLLGNVNYLPYGLSIIEPARKEYKKLVLLEDAMLIHRIMRAPERRIFKVDIGNIEPTAVDTFMNDFADSMKKIPYVNPETGDYDLKFNLMNQTEDFYLPVRGSDTGTSVDTLPGLGNEGQIEDVEYLKNKLLAALKIPKAWLGFDEAYSADNKALAAMDIRFAKTIERIQKVIVSELYKIGIIQLKANGYENKELLDFELELANPSTLYKRQQIDLLNEKMNLTTNMKESKMFSNQYIYETIFGFSKDEWQNIYEQVFEDQKDAFRLEQITSEGNDPKVTGKTFGTPHDLASMQMASKMDGDEMKRMYEQEDGRIDNGADPKQGSYGRDKDPIHGRDPVGEREFNSAMKTSLENFIRQLDKGKAIKKTIIREKKLSLLDESNLLDMD